MSAVGIAVLQGGEDVNDEQIKRAWSRLSQWTSETYDADKQKSVETAAGIYVIAQPSLNWDGLGVEMSEDRIREAFDKVLSRVRCRFAAYPLR